jgi:hypothetical protein
VFVIHGWFQGLQDNKWQLNVQMSTKVAVPFVVAFL